MIQKHEAFQDFILNAKKKKSFEESFHLEKETITSRFNKTVSSSSKNERTFCENFEMFMQSYTKMLGSRLGNFFMWEVGISFKATIKLLFDPNVKKRQTLAMFPKTHVFFF